MKEAVHLSEVGSSMSATEPEVSGARWTLDLAALDRHRVLRGWTRGELARRSHVDQKTLSTMFRRSRRPVLGTVTAVCAAMGLGLEDVIIFDGERQYRKSSAA